MVDEKTMQPQGSGETNTGEVIIQKIYVKDLSFEAPNAPKVFGMEWKPSIDVHFQSEATPLGADQQEVVLSVTVTVSFEEMTVYLVEVQQAGIFVLTKVGEKMLDRVLATVCPNIIFPFVRETISYTVIRGGFPQLLLSPVNFGHLYAQETQRKGQEQSGEEN